MAPKKHKTKVFLASVNKGLENERKAVVAAVESHGDLEYCGYENWLGGPQPPEKSKQEARDADYLILVLGGRLGEIDPKTGKSITELEFREFLFTHAKEYLDDPTRILVCKRVREEDPPEFSDVVGSREYKHLKRFTDFVGKRTTWMTFKNWRELQSIIVKHLAKIPSETATTSYSKLGMDPFDFQLIRKSKLDATKLKSRWAECPCSVKDSGGCDYSEPLCYRPPEVLAHLAQEHRDKLFRQETTNECFRVRKPSFKTIGFHQASGSLIITFCKSTWYNFLGTNYAVPKNHLIRKYMEEMPGKGMDLKKSAFGNNLGMAIVIRDVEKGLYYHTIRSKDGGVAVAEGLKSTSVGTQLHAYDKAHLAQDSLPNILAAATKEIHNEGGVKKEYIKNLVVSGWGIGTRTGIPELLFICDTCVPLHQINAMVTSGEVTHCQEFDTEKMLAQNKHAVIKYEYEIIADLKSNPEKWEPESAVAYCLAIADSSPDALCLGEADQSP